MPTFGGYVHVHVSEREPDHQPDDPDDPPGWEDCTWAAGVEYARAIGQDAPPTLAEAELLRAASGEPEGGGSNLDDLRAGMLARYGWAGPVGANTLAATLPVGGVAVVQGSTGMLPPRLRFTSRSIPHAGLVIRADDLPRVWWCDPLGPAAGYEGAWMTLGELRSFALGLAGGQAMTGRLDSRRSDMVGTVTREPFGAAVTFRTRPGSTLSGYDPARPGGPVITRTWDKASAARASAVASVAWTPGPGPVPRGGPFLQVIDGVYAGLLIVAALVDWTPPEAADAAWERWYVQAPGKS